MPKPKAQVAKLVDRMRDWNRPRPQRAQALAELARLDPKEAAGWLVAGSLIGLVELPQLPQELAERVVLAALAGDDLAIYTTSYVTELLKRADATEETARRVVGACRNESTLGHLLPFVDSGAYRVAAPELIDIARRFPGLRPAILRMKRCPPELLEAGRSDPNPRARVEVARRLQRPEELERLAGDPDEDVASAVAANPCTPPRTLERLAGHREAWVRACVAENPLAPARVLARLAADPSARVREGAAGNLALPAEAQRRLAGDPEEEVRLRLAMAATAARVVERLAADPAAQVRAMAVRNLGPGSRHWSGLARDPAFEVRTRVAEYIPTRGRVADLLHLTFDPRVAVRRALASRSGLPASVLRALAEDPDPKVRARAAR